MIDEAALLALEGAADMAIYGVDATVIHSGMDAPVTARAFWVASPATDDVPFGSESVRVEPRRVIVFRRVGDREDGLALTFPKGTVITAPLVTGQAIQQWLADGPEQLDDTYHYVVVKPDPGGEA